MGGVDMCEGKQEGECKEKSVEEWVDEWQSKKVGVE